MSLFSMFFDHSLQIENVICNFKNLSFSIVFIESKTLD